MDPIQEAYPVPEEGQIRSFNGAQSATFPEDQMSREPTLMFSLPQSLRSEPVETSDY